MASPSLQSHLATSLSSSTQPRPALTTSLLPKLLTSCASIARTLRASDAVSAVGNTNAFGDEQLNVDVAAESLIRSALSECPCAVSASSEEDPVENPVQHSPNTNGPSSSPEEEKYTVAFDPLDGSSIIAPGWAVGTIIGIWEGASALGKDPRTHQVAAILASYGSRNTAVVAVRVPGATTCFEVMLGDDGSVAVTNNNTNAVAYTAPSSSSSGKTRYFAPANLRAAAESAQYMELVQHYIREKYTLRYSGGLVPDVMHALNKGHGIYVSPVTGVSKAKLRRLYELCPVALVVECAGGRAVDAVDGKDVLGRRVEDTDEKGGLVCGNVDEVDLVIDRLIG
jgi:sedoheptulose-bisphosphatase